MAGNVKEKLVAIYPVLQVYQLGQQVQVVQCTLFLQVDQEVLLYQ